jgi:hypothetical protein
MTKDEREMVQASIEQLTIAINGLSKILMLDNTLHENATINYLFKSSDCIEKAHGWLQKIKV